MPAVGGVPVANLSLCSSTDQRTGKPGAYGLQAKVIQTYDDLHRLTSESIANDPYGINGSASYSYDPVGNRLNRSSSIAPVASQSSTYDSNDRLSSDTYDNNGNTTSTNGNSYAYDFENHLTSLNGGSVTYVYDGDGNRVAKITGGVTTNYLVDTNNPTGYAQVVDELQGGAVVRSFTYGHDLISQRIVGSSLSFYQYDGHGSVRLLTNASGAVTDTYDSDAFGNLIYRSGTTPNDYLYSGEQFDANLGFYYLRARYMNPSTSRFWTTDTVEGALGEPFSLHRYLYVAANPVNRLDPSGLFSFLETEGTQAASETINNMSTLQYQSVLRMVQPQLVDEALAEIAGGELAGTGAGVSISAGTALSSALAFFAGFGAGALISTAISNHDDSDKEVFYRVMSTTEYKGLGPNAEITIQGTENFVTQNPEYVIQLAARHPELYQYLAIYQMEAGTRDALIAKGAVSQSAIENTPSLARLPSISTFPKNYPDIVHIKGETGNALTHGLRRVTVGIFNSRIVRFQGVGL